MFLYSYGKVTTCVCMSIHCTTTAKHEAQYGHCWSRWLMALKRAVLCTVNSTDRSGSDRLGSAGSERVVGRADPVEWPVRHGQRVVRGAWMLDVAAASRGARSWLK
jgi:hypothetical protein